MKKLSKVEKNKKEFCWCSKENGFHFLTAKMTQEQLQSFDIEDIMKRIIVRIEEIWMAISKFVSPNLAWQNLASKCKAWEITWI